jgi:hypothetical protein
VRLTSKMHGDDRLYIWKLVRQIENERFARERREEGQIFYDRHEASKELRKKLLDKQSRYRRPLSKLENILESFLTWED